MHCACLNMAYFRKYYFLFQLSNLKLQCMIVGHVFGLFCLSHNSFIEPLFLFSCDLNKIKPFRFQLPCLLEWRAAMAPTNQPVTWAKVGNGRLVGAAQQVSPPHSGIARWFHLYVEVLVNRSNPPAGNAIIPSVFFRLSLFVLAMEFNFNVNTMVRMEAKLWILMEFCYFLSFYSSGMQRDGKTWL